ncbi:alpha/beta hydrolase [Bacteriovorax stolpii]|uniref:Uncharacterized protein n=1 Tax=Bacteriovorax stolpii TaxID=960 RepID=A0A2K9NS47_BACTC|nr:alpha/beta hydrolase [Bacteriovorax stolpii]AUN98312.1 hypothetical protein C0V70_09385 [Bacteriovorax stolpii]QDK41708.1 alpha/beta hydrolase [Bacteriovorax stolpii]TDP52236.1 pimeloyl-ACP methyl ester carboxylesterase [Bacteriovorax stolpii]
MKKFTAYGQSIHYVEKNESQERTLLFIHGNSHSLRSFSNQMDSDELKNFRLIFVDLPGHGESSKEGTYSLRQFGIIISEFIQALRLNNIILIGHSLGGHVAINVLKNFNPDGLFLFGTPPLKKPFDVSAFTGNTNGVALTLENPTAAEIELLMTELNYTGAQKTLATEDFLKSDPRFRTGILADVISNIHEDEINLINSFYGDVMFLVASKESLINNDYIRREFSSELTNTQIKEIDAGHSPQIERGVVFNKMLSDFAKNVFEKKYILNNVNTKQHESQLW